MKTGPFRTSNPDELYDAFLEKRTWFGHGERRAEIDNDGARELVHLAYAASFRTEEGLSPRFRFLVPLRETQVRPEFAHLLRPNLLFEFEDPVLLTPRDIARVSFIANPSTEAFIVRQREKRLYAFGTFALRSLPTMIGAIEWPKPTAVGLVVQSLRPGDVSISEVSFPMSLTHGELSVGPFSVEGKGTALEAWMNDLAEELHAELLEDGLGTLPNTSKSILREFASQLVIDTLSRVAEGGRGGALVVVDDRAETPAQIDVKRRARGGEGLRAALLRFMRAGRRCAVDPTPEAVRDWLVRYRELEESRNAFSRLFNVDGCVVVTKRLLIRGFGGTIKPLSDPYIRGWRAPHRDRFEMKLADLGHTRHQSAARFCGTVPGSLAFVISQDGPIMMMLGEEQGRITVWGGLSPSHSHVEPQE